MASASPFRSRARMSRLDKDAYIDYALLDTKIQQVKERLKRPLTFSEKILYGHLDNVEEADIRRGDSYLKLRPARIACQDATAQMALIQFMSAGLDSVKVPTTIHCDHLIVAKDGYATDLAKATADNEEVYKFLESVCKRYGAGFWKPGAGIIHQIVLENYAYPGGLMIGTDSHTPNAGGLGMAAIGVGGADAVDVMSGLAWELKTPKVIGVNLTGKLSEWASPKDVILRLAGELTVKGATGSIIEYFGEGVKSLSCTGMATITNMGAETGATTSMFPFTEAMGAYLEATGRSDIREASSSWRHLLRADEGAEYDRVINIDLSSLEPFINGPSTPDLAIPLTEFKQAVAKSDWDNRVSAGLIGSCTNSSFEDISRVAHLAKQAMAAGLKPQAPLYLSPGSEATRATLQDSGVLEVFEEAGAKLLSNACGPCCGSWDRQEMPKGQNNSIVTSYNRNFTGRLDSNPATKIFLASPETVIAKTFAGNLDFNPATDSIQTAAGEFRFNPPPQVDLPINGYQEADDGYVAPPPQRSNVHVDISPTSNRIQRLKPFASWNGQDYKDLTVLIKVSGKCTTDHITPAGPWFRYRGHLENISNNTLIGAVNAYNQKVNMVQNVFTGQIAGVPETARDYKQRGQQWVVIAEHNYGEGSSREHAALQPRFLNGVAIIAKSFARIHESNLKKQGMLPLTFSDPSVYDRIAASDRIDLLGLAELASGKPITMAVKPSNGTAWRTELLHTLNEEQIGYFKAGSALNLMALNDASSSQSN
ncbi:aconitate hydratase [Aaosphaeria arxii CBS 175.79]|uniref:Aconitate hydratase, mitochondrial n=1 Tax=Aaosphaeria arxii CBS 175.79 TaxID=1450172 RepID=A0A6A5XGM1_9PLEO|nr:aconitate hydratase [Aaosphaeria arxii CBS 175.79]KAF2011987.1 aconitate hydratase [Aaosphaeria arxii CBS 175.79]